MGRPLNLNDAILACNAHTCFENSAPYTDYSKVVFKDGSPIVSQEDAEAKLAEIRAEYDAKKYQRDRAKEYPTWQDQLDDIYHNGVDGWKATIKATKDKYSKP